MKTIIITESTKTPTKVLVAHDEAEQSLLVNEIQGLKLIDGETRVITASNIETVKKTTVSDFVKRGLTMEQLNDVLEFIKHEK